MENLIMWLSIAVAFLKSDPIYSFILDAFPLMIISTFGAMVEQMNSRTEITGRATLASLMSAVAVALITNVAAREYAIKVHIQILFALCGGIKGKAFLGAATDKVLALVRKVNG